MSFFCNAEKLNLRFTLEDISQATGWKLGTVHGYRSKKWHWFLKEDSEGKFLCKGISGYPHNSFIRVHTQKTDDDTKNLRPRFGQNVDALIDKARESALLAVQAYNNPLTVFRTPAFLVLMNIAFTALFHAIFERNKVDYTYKMSDGTYKIIDGEPASRELMKCADYYFQGKNTPERANLKFLIQLRNKVEHRFLPVLDIAVAGQCQAMLFNFEDLVRHEFGPYFALNQSLALPLQFTEIATHQREAIKRLQSKEYDLIRKYIDDYQDKLPDDILQSQKYSFRVFLMPRLGNHAKSSDLAVEFVHYDPTNPEEMKQYEKQVAMIKERVIRIQVANQGRLRPSTVCKRVSVITGKSFNTHHHTNAWKLYHIRSKKQDPEGCKTEFCQYDEAHNDFVYTEAWVQFLVEKVNDTQ